MLLFALLAPCLFGQTETPPAPPVPHAELTADLVADLERLARWCGENRLLREEAAVWEKVLSLRPAHWKARTGAGYERKDGDWVRPKTWRAPGATNRKLVPEFKQRAGEVVSVAVTDLLPRLDEAGASPRFRHVLLRDLLDLEPKRAELREALGERREGGRWKLVASVDGPKRTKRHVQSAALILRGVPEPEEGVLTLHEKELGIAWTGVRELSEVRVVGTVSTRELADAAKLAQASLTLFRLVFRTGQGAWDGYTIYLMDAVAQRDTFIHFDSRFDDATRKFAKSVQSCWIPSSAAVGIWTDDAARRREWVVRQTFSMMLEKKYGLSVRTGALYEGFGLYLSHKITRRRSTWYVRPSRYAAGDPVSKELLSKNDWLAVARRRWRKEKPSLTDLLGRDVDRMSPGDIVDGYAISVYLLESASLPDLEVLLRALGEGKHFDRVLEDLWGYDAAELEKRVTRWLGERRSR